MAAGIKVFGVAALAGVGVGHARTLKQSARVVAKQSTQNSASPIIARWRPQRAVAEGATNLSGGRTLDIHIRLRLRLHQAIRRARAFEHFACSFGVGCTNGCAAAQSLKLSGS